MNITFYTISEAYHQTDDDAEISSYVRIAHDATEAQEILCEMIRERIEEILLNDDEPTPQEQIDAIENEVLGTHDGYGWYRWASGNQAFAWNVAKKDLNYERTNNG